MSSRIHTLSAPAAQRGAVLVVSLLLLLVMTVLALGASQATRMQERMAGNARDYDLAFQSAESALRTGERLINATTLTVAPFPCSSGRCQVFELGVVPADFAFQPSSWWDTNAWAYATGQTWNDTPGALISGGEGMPLRDPQFFIEEVEEVSDSLTIPPTGPPPSRIYYRITASGEGAAADDNGGAIARAVVQSTFSRRFN